MDDQEEYVVEAEESELDTINAFLSKPYSDDTVSGILTAVRSWLFGYSSRKEPNVTIILKPDKVEIRITQQ